MVNKISVFVPWEWEDGETDGGSLNPSILASISLIDGFLGGLENSYKYGNSTVKYAQ